MQYLFFCLSLRTFWLLIPTWTQSSLKITFLRWKVVLQSRLQKPKRGHYEDKSVSKMTQDKNILKQLNTQFCCFLPKNKIAPWCPARKNAKMTFWLFNFEGTIPRNFNRIVYSSYMHPSVPRYKFRDKYSPSSSASIFSAARNKTWSPFAITLNCSYQHAKPLVWH